MGGHGYSIVGWFVVVSEPAHLDAIAVRLQLGYRETFSGAGWYTVIIIILSLNFIPSSFHLQRRLS